MSLPCLNNQSKPIKGWVHSIESMGTVDGPGIRSVVFLSGCPLRCQYCHNIDVTIPKRGEHLSPEELVTKLRKNKPYFDRSGGGVTFSGGDPLMQLNFLRENLKQLQSEGIHTCVDTSFFSNWMEIESIMPFTDLFMISVKHLDNKKHKALTKVSNRQILENLKKLSLTEQRFWIRFVILPGITDTKTHLQQFTDLMQEIQPELIELLPYHTFGIDKWKALGWQYELKDVAVPNKIQVQKIKMDLEQSGFSVLVNE